MRHIKLSDREINFVENIELQTIFVVLKSMVVTNFIDAIVSA
jgi:hypothetical protein